MNLVMLCRALPLAGLLAGVACAHEPVMRSRAPIQIPDIPGFLTLKCDFHIHTVFSDGLVWPSVRVEEAWREGLDAIAITDHIEYQPHKADLSTNHNRSHEIARTTGKDLDILVVKGSEITRKMPPGHLNAIFLTNSATLTDTNWRAAIAEARRQGAYLFWNHPGWDAQITNGVVRWYPEHTELLEKDMLHGIEVVNGRDYYVEAHRWAGEKNLGMFSNSDIHNPLNLDYHVHTGDHRPITLVFAKERTLDSLKKALFARQTAVYSGSQLIGDEMFLRPIYVASVQVLKNRAFELKGKGRVSVQIHNSSDVDYKLERTAELAEVTIPKEITLAARRTVVLNVAGKTTTQKGRQKITLPYNVTNLLTGPGQPLPVTIELDVTFVPAAK
jgi:predicted metal-dependent phosphoesterase TrpH